MLPSLDHLTTQVEAVQIFFFKSSELAVKCYFKTLIQKSMVIHETTIEVPAQIYSPVSGPINVIH